MALACGADAGICGMPTAIFSASLCEQHPAVSPVLNPPGWSRAGLCAFFFSSSPAAPAALDASASRGPSCHPRHASLVLWDKVEFLALAADGSVREEGSAPPPLPWSLQEGHSCCGCDRSSRPGQTPGPQQSPDSWEAPEIPVMEKHVAESEQTSLH